MHIFPDPLDREFSLIRSLLQSHCPSGVVVSTIIVDRLTEATYVWSVDYNVEGVFPSAKDFDVTSAKKIFQKECPSGGIVGVVKTQYSERRGWQWCVQYKKRTKFSFKKFLPCYSQEPKDYSILVSRNNQDQKVELHEYNEKVDFPKKLYLNGSDITRRVSRNTRLSRNSLSNFFHRHFPGLITQSYPELNTTINPRTQVIDLEEVNNVEDIQSSSIIVKDTSLDVEVENTSIDKLDIGDDIKSPSLMPEPSMWHATIHSEVNGSLSLIIPPNESSADSVVPYSYTRVCQMNKMRDIRVHSLVTRYLSVEFGRDPCHIYKRYNDINILTIDGRTIFEIEISLQSVGLPIKEDLFKLYLEYCTSLGKTRSASVASLYPIRRLLIKKR